MFESVILSMALMGGCVGGVCTADKAVVREVHKTKSVVVQRTTEPVRQVVQRVRARSWRLFNRRG